ncbi:MAG: TonB-dependent receptor [Crocinitomicaceae bacterium]|nr:TonB-dependent receptor [Crocinitomicaceae bacterium]|tara:strand:+ start:3121 stop:5466 length:2346 start_codon:yes stop_codon:yes gene_type:complete
MTSRILITSLVICLSVFQIHAQQLTQNIRGRVIDADSEIPAIGATVVIKDSNPVKGTVTDIDGYFKLENIPVGRVSLVVSYLGYEKKVISNILVGSAKEVFLNIGIVEDVNQLETFEVVGNARTDEAINEMSIISARQLSTEEAKRYAGSLNDPARMAGNFAGVTSNAEGNNDIVVRGNSPKGILWRLEGIEIPNPNHFADEGSTGGPINALNSNMLSNSDFLTGAFAPEYGNATSGVFDMKLRQGNNAKREYSLGVGVLGTDITLEGPFKKGGKSSYLANYRYSSLALLSDAGIVDFGGVPKYQDASFNLYMPSKKFGIFKVFGLGGISHINGEEYADEEETYVSAKSNYGSHMGVIGLNHTYIINSKTYIKSSLSYANNGSDYIGEKRMQDSTFKRNGEVSLDKYSTKAAITVNKKLNARNKLSAGIIHTFQTYEFDYRELNQFDELVTPLSVNEGSSFTQLHTTWKHRFNTNLTMVSGLHFLRFNLNNTYSVEPRLGLSYKVRDNQTLTLGIGLHSKMESLLYYTTNVTDSLGNVSQPNMNLEITKSNHYVLGYDYQFAKNTHIKTEVYFQYLFDVPVENNANSDYSLINQSDWFDNVALVNEGDGRNYGIELTLERYFANNFYYLLTGSVYQSEYKAMNGIWKESRYNGNYNANALIGKEIKFKKPGKDRTLLLNFKASLQGGGRYTPIDLDQSIAQGETVYVNDNYSAQGDDIFFINISAGYRINRKKTMQEFKLEVLNVTNYQAKVREYYNDITKTIESSNQLGLIPNIMYTLNF